MVPYFVGDSDKWTYPVEPDIAGDRKKHRSGFTDSGHLSTDRRDFEINKYQAFSDDSDERIRSTCFGFNINRTIRSYQLSGQPAYTGNRNPHGIRRERRKDSQTDCRAGNDTDAGRIGDRTTCIVLVNTIDDRYVV